MTMTLTDIRSFRKAIRALEREMARELKGQTACCQVTTAQCHILMELDAREPLTVQALAGSLGLDKSTLSRTLDGMVSNGLVNRAENAGDRRALDITLTAKGRQISKHINGECDQAYQDLFKLLEPTKHRTILDSVQSLASAMRSAREGR
jgi:DNA-binding MarR family transcriptional regulator